jgi:hypothetical protein
MTGTSATSNSRNAARLAAQLREPTKAKLFEVLARAGVARVTVIFDGQGDSGQIEDVDAHCASDKQVALPSDRLTIEIARHNATGSDVATLDVRGIIENLCYELLQEQHGGWEIAQARLA